jgi:iodotyrosine deiodinase
MEKPRFAPLATYREYPVEEMQRRAAAFYEDLRRRRTVRDCSGRPVSRDIIERCILTAGTAPSGAHMQPWHFVAVNDSAIKQQIREAAEIEEAEFYRERAPQEWLDALAPLGTDEHKAFLEAAPWLIVVFARSYHVRDDGVKVKHYYVQEFVGIATGLLIAAVHHAGLVSLTHTPSPMRFLTKLLGRPVSERPFLILVVGYPSEDAQVPVLERRDLRVISTFL